MGSKIREIDFKKTGSRKTPANERIAIIEPFEDHSKNVEAKKKPFRNSPNIVLRH